MARILIAISYVFLAGACEAASATSDTIPGRPQAEAMQILESAGVQGGLVVHVGCGRGEVTAALRVHGGYAVHGLDRDAENVQDARRYVRSQKCYGPVSVEHWLGPGLPYVDRLVNLLIVESGPLDEREIMRVLAPRGVALIKRAGRWTRIVKPYPAEFDDWPHYLHSPDNNAVSRDTAIAAPLQHLQWKAGPRYSRHHDKSSSVPAVVFSGGRIFSIVDEGPHASILWDADWKLVARDAFNGLLLWKRDITQWTDQLWPLKRGPANTPRRLVAQDNAVYVTLGLLGPVSKLDAATGDEIKVYMGTEQTEEIIVGDDVLYLVVNPNIDPAKRGGVWKPASKRVMAVQESDGEILWQKELPWIAPLSLTVGEKKVYVCDGPHILAFDRATGDRLWESKELPWREKMPTYFGPTLVAVEDDCLLYAGGENWREHAGSAGLMTCLEADTGKVRWQQPHLPSGYQSPQDIFVIDGIAWCGSLNSKPGEFDTRYPDVAPSTGEFIGYDIKTGRLSKTIPRGADCYWFHHRCHRAKATEHYFLTSRTGIEMINLETGTWDLHHWTRGACLYGIMPANSLIYCPPHPCACYPEAKLSGFNALAGPRSSGGPVPKVKDRLERGPAFDAVQNRKGKSTAPADWPTFRGNPARDGSTTTAVDEELEQRWQTELGGKLSQPIVAAGRIFVASVDEHAVYALDQKTGKVEWTFIAGGRVDSPPTFYRGTLIFGSRDGYVYCVRASDGRLAWRLLTAPHNKRLMAWEQLESVWPVHGSVLVQGDVAYVIAGRSMFLDGGLTFYRLDPISGEIFSSVQMDEKAPDTGKDLHEYVAGAKNLLSMPVASSDILSSDGKRIFMRSQPMDLMGRRERIDHLPLEEQRDDDAHLFVPNGFLDDHWWHRAFWVYGRSIQGGPAYSETGHSAPSGKIMVLDSENLYIFGRQEKYWRWTTPMEYRLFSVDRRLPRPEGDPPRGPRLKRAAFATRWETNLPILTRAMVKAGDTIFACGPADLVDEPRFARRRADQLESLREQASLFAGREGSILCGISAGDGTKSFEMRLDVLPVFDGMIAARGNLYVTTVDGKVVCLGTLTSHS